MRTIGVLLACSSIAVALSGTALAGQKLLQPIVVNSDCGFGCPIDAIKKGSWQIKPSNALGANGLTIKVSVSGATKQGVPVDIPDVYVVIGLAPSGDVCTY